MRWIRWTTAVALAAACGTAAWAQDPHRPAGKPDGDKPAPAGKGSEGKQEAKGDEGKKEARGDDSKKEAKSVQVGQPAPDFTLKGHDGKTYKLSDFKDKTVVIEWLNKDCPVCQKLAKPMHETADELAKKGVVWLAIDSTASHKTEDNQAFAKDQKITYPILEDFDGAVGHAYGAKVTPHMFVVQKGKVAYVGALVEKDGDRNYVKDAVEALLAGKEPPVASTSPYGCTVKYKK